MNEKQNLQYQELLKELSVNESKKTSGSKEEISSALEVNEEAVEKKILELVSSGDLVTGVQGIVKALQIKPDRSVLRELGKKIVGYGIEGSTFKDFAKKNLLADGEKYSDVLFTQKRLGGSLVVDFKRRKGVDALVTPGLRSIVAKNSADKKLGLGLLKKKDNVYIPMKNKGNFFYTTAISKDLFDRLGKVVNASPIVFAPIDDIEKELGPRPGNITPKIPEGLSLGLNEMLAEKTINQLEQELVSKLGKLREKVGTIREYRKLFPELTKSELYSLDQKQKSALREKIASFDTSLAVEIFNSIGYIEKKKVMEEEKNKNEITKKYESIITKLKEKVGGQDRFEALFPQLVSGDVLSLTNRDRRNLISSISEVDSGMSDEIGGLLFRLLTQQRGDAYRKNTEESQKTDGEKGDKATLSTSNEEEKNDQIKSSESTNIIPYKLDIEKFLAEGNTSTALDLLVQGLRINPENVELKEYATSLYKSIYYSNSFEDLLLDLRSSSPADISRQSPIAFEGDTFVLGYPTDGSIGIATNENILDMGLYKYGTNFQLLKSSLSSVPSSYLLARDKNNKAYLKSLDNKKVIALQDALGIRDTAGLVEVGKFGSGEKAEIKTPFVNKLERKLFVGLLDTLGLQSELVLEEYNGDAIDALENNEVLIQEKIKELVSSGDLVAGIEAIVSALTLKSDRPVLRELGNDIVGASIASNDFEGFAKNTFIRSSANDYDNRKFYFQNNGATSLVNLEASREFLTNDQVIEVTASKLNEGQITGLDNLPKGGLNYVMLVNRGYLLAASITDDLYLKLSDVLDKKPIPTRLPSLEDNDKERRTLVLEKVNRIISEGDMSKAIDIITKELQDDPDNEMLKKRGLEIYEKSFLGKDIDSILAKATTEKDLSSERDLNNIVKEKTDSNPDNVSTILYLYSRINSLSGISVNTRVGSNVSFTEDVSKYTFSDLSSKVDTGYVLAKDDFDNTFFYIIEPATYAAFGEALGVSVSSTSNVEDDMKNTESLEENEYITEIRKNIDQGEFTEAVQSIVQGLRQFPDSASLKEIGMELFENSFLGRDFETITADVEYASSDAVLFDFYMKDDSTTVQVFPDDDIYGLKGIKTNSYNQYEDYGEQDKIIEGNKNLSVADIKVKFVDAGFITASDDDGDAYFSYIQPDLYASLADMLGMTVNKEPITNKIEASEIIGNRTAKERADRIAKIMGPSSISEGLPGTGKSFNIRRAFSQRLASVLEDGGDLGVSSSLVKPVSKEKTSGANDIVAAMLKASEGIYNTAINPFTFFTLSSKINTLPTERRSLARAFQNIEGKSLLRFVKDVFSRNLLDLPNVLAISSLVLTNSGVSVSGSSPDVMRKNVRKFLSSNYKVSSAESKNTLIGFLVDVLAQDKSGANEVQESMYKFIETDRTQSHAFRVKRLKEMDGLMKIINNNPVLSEKFKDMHIPSSRFKHETETSLSGNIHHRQLTSFLSTMVRDPALRRLFHDEALRLARKKSDQLRKRIKDQGNKISLGKLRVGLGINAGIMAETENWALGESTNNTLYIGQEDYFGGSFNLGGHAEHGFMTNSRNRPGVTTKEMLPTFAGAINHPGMMSMLGEADMHSGMYSNDNDRGFEALSKFYFSANYLFGAEIVTQTASDGSGYKVYLKNKHDNTLVEVETEDISYLTGLGVQKRGFTSFDRETYDAINESKFSKDDIIKEFVTYKKSSAYKDPSDVPLRRLQNFPKYATGLDIVDLAKDPNVNLQELLRGANIAFIGEGDTAKILLEKIYVHRSNTPRQAIGFPKSYLVGSKDSKESINAKRPRYSFLAPFYPSKNLTTDVKVFPVDGRSAALGDGGRNLFLSRIGELDDIVRSQPEYQSNTESLGVDLVIDCSGLDSQKGIDGILHTLEDERMSGDRLTGRYMLSVLEKKRIGTKLMIEDGSELIIKDIQQLGAEEGYVLGMTYVSPDKTSVVEKEILLGQYEIDELKDINDFRLADMWFDIKNKFDLDSSPVSAVTYKKYNDTGTVGLVKAKETYQKEVIDNVFGDKNKDGIYIYRSFPDGKGLTTFQGPNANIPFSDFEKKLLKELGISENQAARFRYQWRIYAQVVENLRKKKLSGIGSAPNSLFEEAKKTFIKSSEQKKKVQGPGKTLNTKEIQTLLEENTISTTIDGYMPEKILGILLNELMTMDIEKSGKNQSFELSIVLDQTTNFDPEKKERTSDKNIEFRPENPLTALVMNVIGDELYKQKDIMKYLVLRATKKMKKKMRSTPSSSGKSERVVEKIRIPFKQKGKLVVPDFANISL